VSHKSDFSNLILLDERYLNPQQKNQLPQWLKHDMKTYENVLKAKRHFVEFFKNVKKKKLEGSLKRFDQVRLSYGEIEQTEHLWEVERMVSKARESYMMRFGYMKDGNNVDQEERKEKHATDDKVQVKLEEPNKSKEDSNQKKILEIITKTKVKENPHEIENQEFNEELLSLKKSNEALEAVSLFKFMLLVQTTF
jgi:hypothetical protein